MKRMWLLLPILLLLPFAGDFAFSAATPQQDEETGNKGGWLGVMLKHVKTVHSDKEESTEHYGAYVSDVIDDGPADAAGIMKGDRIIALNNLEVGDPDDLIEVLRDTKSGETASVTLMRDGKQMKVDVKLGEAKRQKNVIVKRLRMPNKGRTPNKGKMLSLKRKYEDKANHMRMLSSPNMIWHQRGVYGFQLETLSPQLGEYFGAPEGKGVLIKKIVEDSDAAKAGFKAGDVIVKAGKKTVEESGDFKHVLGAFDAGEKIPVRVLRKGKEKTIELTAKEDADNELRMDRFDVGEPHMYRFFHHDDDFEGLEDLEDMDIDIDIDMDELHDGMKEMRIMLNGKELELDELHEELREHLEELHEDVDVEVDEGRVRIRTKKI